MAEETSVIKTAPMSSDVVMADAEAGNAGDGELVWPWTGILATDGDDTAASALACRAQQQFAGITTTALQEATVEQQQQQRHFLVLHFGKRWEGLRDAMSLAGRFAGAGRREWRRRGGSATGVVFGWAAGEEDLHGDGEASRFLREAGAAARSAADVEGEDASAAAKFSGLTAEYERRNRFMEAVCEEKLAAVQAAAEEMSWLHGELKELRNITDNIIPAMNHDVHEENEKLKAELETIKEEIDIRTERTKELKDRRARLECSNVHKKEMEVINAKIIQLEKQLEQRQSLESTIRQLNIKLQAGKNLRKEDHQDLYNIMMSLKENLDQEQQRLEKSCVQLMNRARMYADELRENRQELIKGLERETITGNKVIGVKRMGELDEKAFHLACKRKYRDDDPDGQAERLVSRWKDELHDPSWHPFTIIQVDGEDKEVVDADDQKLRELQAEYGDGACNAVKAALGELNEYKPHGRHAMNELWNFREGRKATTAEVVRHILEQLKTGS